MQRALDVGACARVEGGVLVAEAEQQHVAVVQRAVGVEPVQPVARARGEHAGGDTAGAQPELVRATGVRPERLGGRGGQRRLEGDAGKRVDRQGEHGARGAAGRAVGQGELDRALVLAQRAQLRAVAQLEARRPCAGRARSSLPQARGAAS